MSFYNGFCVSNSKEPQQESNRGGEEADECGIAGCMLQASMHMLVKLLLRGEQ
jgi:hypothetical protein